MIRSQFPDAFPRPEAGICMECRHHAAARVLGDEAQPLQPFDARTDRGTADTSWAHASSDLGEAERILIVRDRLTKEPLHLGQRS